MGVMATTHVVAMKYDIFIFIARTKEWNCFFWPRANADMQTFSRNGGTTHWLVADRISM